MNMIVFFDMHGLHLNEYSAGKMALNFVKRIRPILNSKSSKQKVKHIHLKISSF